jgi:restriction endonuclease S subunit
VWFGEAKLSDLRSRSCWMVEFFCEEIVPAPTTAYPLRSVGDLVDIRREALEPQDTPNVLMSYIGMENIESFTGSLVGFAPRYGKEIKSRSKVFRPGDVLYGRLRPYLNKVYVAAEPVGEGICSGEFYVLVPKPMLVLPHFLRALLSSSYVHQYVSKLQRGSALPRLQLQDLLSVQVPVPSVREQVEFERFLIARAKHQQRLAKELAELPQRTLDEFAQSLETGEVPL